MLEWMKKRGFDTQDIVKKLYERGIEIKPQTMTKYLAEARPLKKSQKSQKTKPSRPLTPKLTGLPSGWSMTDIRMFPVVDLLSSRIHRWMNCKEKNVRILFADIPALAMPLSCTYNPRW